MSLPEFCPNCKKSFQGNPIPEEYRENYGDSTHFSTVIACYSWEEDRTVSWMCPFCKHTWERVQED